MKSSRILRKQIIDALFAHSSLNSHDYEAYITACNVGWMFRDSPTGMTTRNQAKTAYAVHTLIEVLCHEQSSDPLNEAHRLIHELGNNLVAKLRSKESAAVDDMGLEHSNDDLLEKHEHDFAAWADELGNLN